MDSVSSLWEDKNILCRSTEVVGGLRFINPDFSERRRLLNDLD